MIQSRYLLWYSRVKVDLGRFLVLETTPDVKGLGATSECRIRVERSLHNCDEPSMIRSRPWQEFETPTLLVLFTRDS